MSEILRLAVLLAFLMVSTWPLAPPEMPVKTRSAAPNHCHKVDFVRPTST
jgi:hypothetical protein